MNDLHLDRLERDVETARARLAMDLATLRAPSTFSEFKENVKREAITAKDTLVDNAKASVQETAQNLLEDLKARAAANPAAALAIGAGVAWRLIQHPPIATVLVGAGLVSLLRTTPARTDGSGQVGYLSHARQRLKEQTAEAADELQHLAGQASEVVKEKAVELAEAARDRVVETGAEAEAAARQGAAVAARAGERASALVQDTLGDQEARDKLLLGAAGLAVAAALGIALDRRLQDS